jgi:capsular polysaccharide transport system permease protein
LPLSPSAARRVAPLTAQDSAPEPGANAAAAVANNRAIKPVLAASAAPVKSDATPLTAVPGVAGSATIKRRHISILSTFVALVALPVLISATYLWVFAKDQYASTLAFSIRKEDVRSSLDILGGLSKLSGSASSDSDVLYEFIRSQELVAEINRKLDLRKIYAKAWPMDPVFAFNPTGTIEDLQRHWARKVQITYDAGTGLMRLRVLAFDPVDARTIATAILEESTKTINGLSDDAREDATRYAREELDTSVERLKAARSSLTAYRLRNQIVDPQADLQGQMGVLNTLQTQLAGSFVDLDLLRLSTQGDDARVQKIERRIEVIQNRIASERKKFGEGGQGPGGEDYATLVAEYERLSVDREFAEQTYRAALVSYEGAKSEAQRKSRYLAAHIQPTMAERSAFPQRWTLLGLTGFFLLMAWGIGVLIFYSVRDRR